uniref:COPA/B second beta-propeller domain-containing protein n=2 Tax=Aegilops tauschii subsp. strangulata TaxID=200361 RepID=A0A453NQ52_AEGTS
HNLQIQSTILLPPSDRDPVCHHPLPPSHPSSFVHKSSLLRAAPSPSRPGERPPKRLRLSRSRDHKPPGTSSSRGSRFGALPSRHNAAPVGYQGNRDASYWDLLGECLVWCRLCRFCVWLYQRKLAQRSERVKSADLHPTEPWILSSLYSGSVCIWNYQTQTMVKSFEVTELPVRSAKFIARKQWVVAGADDMFIRVYNYNTMDKVKVFEAHTDYIRCVAVHPTQPFVLSSSDDMLIKLWDWDKGWACTHIFEGHSHYVMQVTFNPKDTNTFASASLDRTIKIWSIGSPDPNFTLDGHSKGVNCVDYFTGGDRPFLITGSDDQTAKVWDYQTKSCVQTLEGHAHNVSAVCFHPELPIIITGSEDGTVRLWHSTTYRLENTLNYGLERVWALGYMKGSRRIVIGYDEGTIMIKIGREVPVASMDNSGKIIWAKHNEIQTVNIKTVGAGNEIADGERLPLAVKELGSCDLYPQNLRHNPNGRFVVVCGDGEYIIYTALAWRNRSFGSALEFAWSSDGEYAVRESTSRIKIYSKNFQERKSIRPTFSVERVFGGVLLAMCTNDFICFYDWADCRLIRRIDVNVKVSLLCCFKNQTPFPCHLVCYATKKNLLFSCRISTGLTVVIW